MRKRAIVLLCATSAAAGALAMLVGLDSAHHYGVERARSTAHYWAELNIDTGEPRPPPNAEARAEARPACEALTRASGVSLQDLRYASGLLGRPVRHVDDERLERSFSYFDGLRMTLAGLSNRDQALAQSSIASEPNKVRLHTDLFHLQQILRTCGYLSEARSPRN